MERKRKLEGNQENGKKVKSNEPDEGSGENSINTTTPSLPNEIWEQIFQFLPTTAQLFVIRCVCRHWKLVLESFDELWKLISTQRWKVEESSQYLPANNWFQR